VKPPYRSAHDLAALRSGIADGTIQVICSDHSPEDVESKDVEFDFASYGIIGLESAFAVARTAMGDNVSLEQLVNCFSVNPRKILNLDAAEIKEGAKACLTVFDPDMKWDFSEESVRSRSRNSPFIGKTLTGKALAVYNNGVFERCS
jgi:dihydroorotase